VAADVSASYVVAVRELCEFSAREGDLDLRFSPSPSAQEGMAGHAKVQASRGSDYQPELPLEGSHGALLVRGRADGYDPTRRRLEEIKTYRGQLSRMPHNQRQLHWAQLKIYGCLLARELQLDEVELALVYFEVTSQKQTLLLERCTAEQLEAFFAEHCERFLAWAEQELQHRAARDAALTALRFPHAAFRSGQRSLAEAVYKAVSTGYDLLAQAPTGIGKTLGTLFPMLKAFAPQRLDKLFFLAAKTPGRQLALVALQVLEDSNPGLPLRVLELTAREKACEYPERACNGDSCPLAKGFFDRLPAARQAAAQARRLDRANLRRIALEHDICPYFLAQEMARWSDLLVGDYNYYFDQSALLHGLTQANSWQVAVLVDEAHNLVERARRMYSAELNPQLLSNARKVAPASLKTLLTRVARHWRALHAEQTQAYMVRSELPASLLSALQELSSTCSELFAQSHNPPDPLLRDLHFAALQFCRLAESFGEHSLFDISLQAGQRGKNEARLCLRNLVPAPFLAPRFELARSSVLFSATLGPRQYQLDLLGLPANTPWVDVESPFTAAQLQVQIARHISTRYADRAASLAPIAELINARYQQHPGNYLAFFSSFDYLQQAVDLLIQRYPDLPVWQQSRRMDEAARNAFLERFVEGGRGIGFAVLGGAFGEGIDLPGERLIGAFIATLGLPQLNPINEQMRERMQRLFGAGYAYTYLYPGLQKVVQAAGRVIRTSADRGSIHLIDDRFAKPQIRQLLPNWWQVE
jgi:DNA excision repair protein ERCC-2